MIFENESFAERPNSPIIGIGLIKIYLIGNIVPIIKNLKKVLYQSTLLRRGGGHLAIIPLEIFTIINYYKIVAH